MRKLILLVTLSACSLIHSQENGEEELGAWYMYFGMNRISEKFSIHSEAQFRLYETTAGFNQLLLRTGLNYHINDHAILTGGYAYILTDPTFEGDEPLVNEINEHRIFQQFILTNKVWELLFEHRYRLEQRFITIDERSSVNFDRRTEHRARYRLQVTLPLTNTFFLNFYDEIFINLQDNLFDQNRLYVALGVHITENSNIQLGYLRNQFSNAVFDRIQIGFFFNPDLRKKSKRKS